MRLGLGISLAAATCIVASTPAAYDPAELSLTGWWRATYLASPWPGTPSAGTSGARTLLDSSNPTPDRGESLLGLTPANFNGTDDRLNDETPILLDSYLTASSWWIGMLVKVDTAAAAGAVFYEDETIVGEQNGGWGVSATASGLRACNYDGDFSVTPFLAFSTGEWMWVDAWLEGGVLSISINGGTPQTEPVGNLTAVSARQLRVGANWNSTAFFDGQLAELMIAGAKPSAATCRRIRESYVCDRYGINLTGDVGHVCPPVRSGTWEPCTAPTARLYAQSTKTAAAAYHQRDGARLHWFNGKYWLLGGWWSPPSDWDGGGPQYTTNEVWSSPDLVTWTLELAHDMTPPTSGPGARWTPRHTFMSWVHDGKLWVMGSDQYPDRAADGIPSDVWSSPDGTTWTRVAATSPWGGSGRAVGAVGYSGVWNPIPGYLDGYFHVMGGHRYTDRVTDVLPWPATAEHWRSNDGITWERLEDMPFVRAGVLDAVTLCGTMFVISGNAGNNETRDLRSDTWAYHGTAWQQMSTTSKGMWTARDYVGTAAFDDKLWLLTGFDGGNARSACWSRDFGRTWDYAFAPTYPNSHADGIAVSSAGIAIASGNGMVKGTYRIELVP